MNYGPGSFALSAKICSKVTLSDLSTNGYLLLFRTNDVYCEWFPSELCCCTVSPCRDIHRRRAIDDAWLILWPAPHNCNASHQQFLPNVLHIETSFISAWRYWWLARSASPACLLLAATCSSSEAAVTPDTAQWANSGEQSALTGVRFS